MAIDIHRENLVTLSWAAKKLHGKPHVSSLWRWARMGLRGTRLEYVRIGHKILTSLEALDRFANALAAADEQSVPQQIHATNAPDTATTTAARRAELQRADEILIRDGILNPPAK